MREILFRGKLKDKDEWIGEWIEGIYCPCYWDLYMRRVEKPRIIILSNKGKTDGLWREVIPETVGQFTGLTDKNGVKIFEGDICRFKRFNDVHIGKIVFNATTASFVMWYQPIVGAYGEKATQKMLLSVCDDIEVIGNIHDNPELLGGENNGINR